MWEEQDLLTQPHIDKEYWGLEKWLVLFLETIWWSKNYMNELPKFDYTNLIFNVEVKMPQKY